MTTANAFWTVSPGLGAIRKEDLAVCGPDEVQVKARYSGISRGTETLVFTGRVPPDQTAAMRCPFQQGTQPDPVKYGYASVGEVEAGAPGWIGRTVFCLHPHQDRYIVPKTAVHAVPAGVPAERAVLAANMETALNILWDAGIGPGDRVAVVGLGVVGCLTAWLVGQIPGTDLLAIDIDPGRAAIAEALSLPFETRPPTDYDADVVIHATGQPDGLQSALLLAGQEATVIEASWFGTTPVPLPLGGAFHSRRLTLRSSQVGQVAPARRPRWTHARRLAKALALLEDPALDALIDGESAFPALPGTMSDLAAGRLHALCHRIRYES